MTDRYSHPSHIDGFSVLGVPTGVSEKGRLHEAWFMVVDLRVPTQEEVVISVAEELTRSAADTRLPQEPRKGWEGLL